MIRISTIFIAICMVLVAASLGLILYSVAGINGPESAIVALTALTFLILYNAVSMRLRDRTDVGSQIADLSRGTADLARQVAEFGRRLAAVEGRVASANSTNADRVQSVVGEINELGTLVKQLAASVASHEDLLTAPKPPAATVDSELHKELPLAVDDKPVAVTATEAPAAGSRASARAAAMRRVQGCRYFFFFAAGFFFAEDLGAEPFAAGFFALPFAVFLTGFLAGFFTGVLAAFFFAAAAFARVSAGALVAGEAAGGAVKVSGCSTFTRRTISPR